MASIGDGNAQHALPPHSKAERERRHGETPFQARDATTATQVNEYRAFTIGHDGHITASRAFRCTDDSEAVVWAKQWVDGHDIELWSGERLVIRLGHREDNKEPPKP